MCFKTILFDYLLPRRNLEIDEVIIHPLYDDNDEWTNFDIALLKLKDSLDLEEFTPACLPERNQTFVGETAWVYGWGYFENGNDDISDILRQTTQRVIASDTCGKYWKDFTPAPNQLCAFGLGQDSCGGDSGGPLTVEENGRHILIGAVSFGAIPCAKVDISIYSVLH